MNQFLTSDRLRGLLRLEVAIVVVVLLLAVVWYSQRGQTSDAKALEAVVVEDLAKARRAQAILSNQDDVATLEERKRQLQSLLELPDTLFRDDSLKFGNDFLSYVDEQSLALPSYGEEDASAIIGEEQHATIRYSLVVQGSSAALVGVLTLLEDLPAKVQAMRFNKLPDGPNSWEMSLELDVFYQDEGA